MAEKQYKVNGYEVVIGKDIHGGEYSEILFENVSYSDARDLMEIAFKSGFEVLIRQKND